MTCIEFSAPNRLLLVLNGTETLLQVILGQGNEIYYAKAIRVVSQSMRFLPEILEDCFRDTGVKASLLEGIACVRGPGMFTGIRVVLSVGMGLAKGWKIPMAGIDYLPLLASQSCRQSTFQSEVWVCTYARKSVCYVQGFTCPEIRPLTPPLALSVEEALQFLAGRQNGITLVGSGIRENQSWWMENIPEARILDKTWDHPSCSLLLHEAIQAEYLHDPVRPLYVRASDAEDHLLHVANQRGISYQQAKAGIPEY